jgi:Xaa-Pro aminopeptidase
MHTYPDTESRKIMHDKYALLPEKEEFADRIEALFDAANAQNSDWDAIFIVDKVTQYYFTGTVEDGLFVLLKNGNYAYFVRRSIERASLECQIDNLFPMTSYRDVRKLLGDNIHKVYMETEIVTYGMLQRIQKHFDITDVIPVGQLIGKIRAVKSPYELTMMEESGRQHQHILESVVPNLLAEGKSEADFVAELYAEMVKLGYQGVSRFAMFQTELVAGQFGFGENSLYPTNFDGPGGMKGMCPAVPIVGDRQRFLKKGDLVFADIGYGFNGYHSDRTQVYMFGANPPEWLLDIHRQCKAIQKQTAELLKPGNIPSQIHETVISSLDSEFSKGFMGYDSRTVSFLGHGVGLTIDEYPVISKGFDEPLQENMVLAVEPKKGVKGIGMVGVEDTYVVTPKGGRCITGGEKDIIVVL